MLIRPHITTPKKGNTDLHSLYAYFKTNYDTEYVTHTKVTCTYLHALLTYKDFLLQLPFLNG